MPFFMFRIASSSADHPQGISPHPGQSHIQGGYLVALLSKGVQKRQFKGNIVIVGIWFPEIRPDISKGFLKIFRGIPLHHGSHGASHKLGHPACPDLFLELRGTAVHLHRLRKTDLPFVLLKGMIITIVPVRIALLFSGLRQLPAQAAPISDAAGRNPFPPRPQAPRLKGGSLPG